MVSRSHLLFKQPLVRSLAEAKASRLYVQTSSEARPSFYAVGTEDPSPAVKSGRGVMLITHPPSRADVKNE
jgi:hypothetical protein